MATSSCRGQYFTIKVRECLCERIATFVRMSCSGRVDADVVVDQELLQHFPGGDEEIAVAPLTSELEGVLCRRFRPTGTIGNR